MNWQEYINDVVGKPWVNRTWGPESYDCFGILIDSYKRMDGINLPRVNGYSTKKPIQEIGNDEAGMHWETCEQRKAECFACYDDKGNMCHVGRVTPFGALHAFGDNGIGQVHLHQVNQLDRIMRSSMPKFRELKFFRFKHGCNTCTS